MISIKKIIVPVVLLLFVLNACKVTQPFSTPVVKTDSLYRDVYGTDTTTIAQLSWKDVFSDTLLQKLINETIDNNLDLKIAYSRINEAEASFLQSKAAFYPSVSGSAGITLNSSSNSNVLGQNATAHAYTAEIGASWEADIWGKLKSSKHAALANLLQLQENGNAVISKLVADIALNYYHLLALDRELEVTRGTVQNWQSIVNIMKELKKADVVTSAAIVQSDAAKYATDATIPDIIQNIRETENMINFLAGKPAGPVARSSLDLQKGWTNINTGVPVQLLANRPDVKAAEQNVRYYFELTNVARTYFYPSVTIAASGGYLTNNVFSGPVSLIGNFVGGLVQPVFNQRINKTRLEIAKAQQQQALLNFQTSILSSGKEVSDALFSYQAAKDKQSIRSKQLINLQKSVAYTEELVKYGFANYTEVLNAQQNLLNGQLGEINDKQQELQSFVSLYNALGGGWK
ncbi:TolC family protein [Chitinophagaceae bacterium 26-R-25]|nr:TolC family protein [Chitinophagaceae bacterium 26-R-25]